MKPRKGRSQSPDAFVDDGLKVAKHQEQQLDALSAKQSAGDAAVDATIQSSEALLKQLGRSLPSAAAAPTRSSRSQGPIVLPSWDDVLAEARAAIPERVDVYSLLSPEEVATVAQRHNAIGKELGWASSLDRFDWGLAIAAGLLAGATDVILVGIPAHGGFLGSKPSSGGPLSNVAKTFSGKVFPPNTVRQLEKAYSVSFDPSTNAQLKEAVAGLGPRTHRYHSLGHDPLLGFVFGVRDILTGEFTAIDKNGRLIVQHVADAAFPGEDAVARLLGALGMVAGHLASDVATPAGLPAPLMPLLQFLQFGKAGRGGYTIGEVSRQMYRSGYDLRHFAATSVPVIISELFVRVGYFARAASLGKSLKDAIPNAAVPKLRRQLLVAHSVALLVNAGKVYFTQNPLSLSWAQILVFLRYLLPELGFLLFGAEAERAMMVQKDLLSGYGELLEDIDRTIASMREVRLVV